LRYQASQTRDLGWLNAGATLLGGASKAAIGYAAGAGGGGGGTSSAGFSSSYGYQQYRAGERSTY
jgi:hypothetical protein